jgi:hypothetical protein
MSARLARASADSFHCANIAAAHDNVSALRKKTAQIKSFLISRGAFHGLSTTKNCDLHNISIGRTLFDGQKPLSIRAIHKK